MNLGKTISQLRERKGLNQGKFAEILSITQSYLSQIENNKRLPNMALLEKISTELSTPLPFIFFLSMDEKDVPENKRPHFKALEPVIKKFIGELIGIENED